MLEYINWNPITKFSFWEGVFSIHIYSLMFVFSFITGWYVMTYIYRIDHVNQKYLDPLLVYTVLGTFIGARLGQVFFYDFLYFSDNHWIEAFFPIVENPKKSFLLGMIKGYEFVGYRGLSSHGATIGISLSSFLYSRKILKRNFFWLCDRLCIISALSSVFIRIGNFFNSEIVGTPSNLPWAVKFVQMDTEYGEIIPRHPTQIYESISYLFIFLFLWFFYRKRNTKKPTGYISGVFFIFLWGARFLLEFLKEPQGDEMIHLLFMNTGQCLSIPYIIFGVFILFFSQKKKSFFS
ncbi:prolipoprotein diacylglyceryl transferase [Blattabacterium cuenoti]|uniref:prolipoprotein diacylglyceryl transferase n=1 Tax=Blattabacterium cuenoti TaxID=1653831 RepID=UPI00163B921C|nr:prolipoprotein diacylglyceryl transferase [Blattabacterium cuenoti]